MGDLEIAKKCLQEEDLTLSVVKDAQVLFKTSSRGISGFLSAIQKLGERLRGASVADKIVGKAIALLCLYARIERVYGAVMSREAKKLFQENKIHSESEKLVESIQGNCKSATCPFEGLALGITDPEEAYKKLKALQDSLGQRR